MKLRYTSNLQLFHVAFVVTLLLLSSQVGYAQTVFTQDFSSSTSVSDYINNSSPGIGQFTQLGPISGTATVASINSGKLRFVKGSNQGSFIRASRFAINGNAPRALRYEFDLQVTASTAQASAVTFRVGDNFPTGSSVTNVTTASNNFGLFLVDFAGSNTFRLKSSGGTQYPVSSSAALSGQVHIDWFLNQSSSTLFLF